ncbi:MAG: exosortase O [Cyanobacteria bacterium J06642_3]
MAIIPQSIRDKNQKIATILLIVAWLGVNLWTFQWWLSSFQNLSPLNISIIAIATLSLLWYGYQRNFLKLESPSPQVYLQPVLLMLAGELGAIALKWTINIPQLTLLCFIIGSYGLLGLFLSPSSWKKGLSFALIAACTLPFAIAFNSGLGFPVRVITAHAVAQTLSDFHLSAASSHDIIVMENGIAQVDLPCSGMKSLWTGTIFLLGATWLEKRKIGWRWVMVAIANLFSLVVVNILRVFTLVVLIEVVQQRQIAEVLHVPLGILGFVLASAITWRLLQTVPRYQDLQADLHKAIAPEKWSPISQDFKWLIIAVMAIGLVGQINPNQSETTDVQNLHLPKSIVTETLPLTQTETNFFDNPANPLVQKLRFQTEDLTGSMLMVASDTWQAHHPPELCFLGNGFKVDSMNSQILNDQINARWLNLQNGSLSATYWFQSAHSTTDDFVERIWDHLTQHQKTWVMVSVLFDSPEQPDDLEIKNFTQTIYQAIDQELNPQTAQLKEVERSPLT